MGSGHREKKCVATGEGFHSQAAVETTLERVLRESKDSEEYRENLALGVYVEPMLQRRRHEATLPKAIAACARAR